MTSATRTSTPTKEHARIGVYPGQCHPRDALRLLDLAGGVVLQGHDGHRTARKLASLGRVEGVRLDPATYRDRPASAPGVETLPGLEDLGVDWVREQRALRLDPIYTPAERVRAGDIDGLMREVVGPCRVGVVRVLAIDSRWLTDRHLPVLTRSLAESACRSFALVLGDQFDPLGEPRKVRGLQQLLAWSGNAGVELDLLRTDMCGLRAVVSGAHFGGIGLSTSTRHLGLPFAPGQRDDFKRRQRSPLVFVPRLMHWVRANVLGALSAWPNHPLNQCSCPTCLTSDTSGLDRFDQTEMGAELKAEVRAHDAWAMTSIIDSVMTASSPSARLLELQDAAIESAFRTTVDTRIEIVLPPWFEHWK